MNGCIYERPENDYKNLQFSFPVLSSVKKKKKQTDIVLTCCRVLATGHQVEPKCLFNILTMPAESMKTGVPSSEKL